MTKEIRYSQLTLKEMAKLYNERANEIGESPLKPTPKDRFEMGKRLALIMTRTRAKTAPKPQAGPPTLREVVIEEVCRVSHYENGTTDREGNPVKFTAEQAAGRRDMVTVGFTYSIVLQRIKERMPKSGVSPDSLRVHASKIKQGFSGYEHAKLPAKRPYSNKGKKSCR